MEYFAVANAFVKSDRESARVEAKQSFDQGQFRKAYSSMKMKHHTCDSNMGRSGSDQETIAVILVKS